MGTCYTLIVECAWRLHLDQHGVTRFNASAPFVGVARIELGKAYALACECAEAPYRFPSGERGPFEGRVPDPFERECEELKLRWFGTAADFVRIARKVLESVDDTSLLALFGASHFVESVTTFRDRVRVSLWSDQ